LNVLSLFDGMSAGQLALQRAGIKVDNYFASEIDKYAISITQKHFPDTIQLGDITNWKEWNLPTIDLIIGGSPCQGFSLSGLGLNFEDPRSKLFFVFADIVKVYKPKYFMLENVKMKPSSEAVITKYMGVEPIEINSALVSAQSRRRLYWTNIPNITPPQDKCIVLKDIIESGVVDRDKSYCLDANYYKGGSETTLKRLYFEKARRQIVGRVPQSAKRLMVQEVVGGAIRGRRIDNEGNITESKAYPVVQQLEIRKDDKSNSITTVQKDTVLVGEDLMTYRMLTPLECERLQTFPDNYTEGVSNTQRYKMLGNSWTVDMVAHIFSFMKG